MKAIMAVSIDVDPVEIDRYFAGVESRGEQANYGEVAFHREVELDFLPFVGMPFEVSLLDSSEDSNFHSHGRFLVQEVEWVEVDDGRIYLWLMRDRENSDEIHPREFDMNKWTLGDSPHWRRKK